MNNLIILLITLIFLNNCSFNENSSIWIEQENLDKSDNAKKVFAEEEKFVSEFNQGIKLDLSK